MTPVSVTLLLVLASTIVAMAGGIGNCAAEVEKRWQTGRGDIVDNLVSWYVFVALNLCNVANAAEKKGCAKVVSNLTESSFDRALVEAWASLRRLRSTPRTYSLWSRRI